MDVKKVKNNKVLVSGEITKSPVYSHQLYGEKFYIFTLKVMRLSGYDDELPIMVSEQTHDLKFLEVGKRVRVTGQFRSYNKKEDAESHVILSIYARKIEFLGEYMESENINNILLDGYICKNPLYRKTPQGRKIAELILAVNRPYGKTDYIPVICWGQNAKNASTYDIGANIRLHGRVQSRRYIKRNDEYELTLRTVYEVSADNLMVLN